MAPNVFFTSDTHYGHANVIRYANRPFSSAEEMDEAMVRNWNEVVRPGDLVYHLGDFALSRSDRAVRIAKRLVGQKYIVWGNHDKDLRKDQVFCQQWVWNRDLTQVEVAGQKITLCHYAMRTWASAHHGAWQLYGHSHGSLKDIGGRTLDVGVDCWGFTPVSFETLRQRMREREFATQDHHHEEAGHEE